MNKTKRKRNETIDILITAIDEVINDRELSIKLCMLICKELGGLQNYIPKNIHQSKYKDTYLAIFETHIDEQTAIKVFESIGAFLGGWQIYIPQYSRIFRSENAKEIYELFDGTCITTKKIAKKYGISFVQVYNLYNKEKTRRASKKGDKDDY